MLRSEESLAAAGTCEHQAGGSGSPVVRNFHQVTPWLYRGGQPDAAGARYLKDMGIKTVVCLRWSPWAIDEERRLIVENGMEFVSIPLNYWTFPDQEEIASFFAILDDESRRPVFVHCKHGADRTGLMLAFYRMVKEGWHVDQAYHEMRNRGFHRIKMHHFKWALYSFARRRQEVIPG